MTTLPRAKGRSRRTFGIALSAAVLIAAGQARAQGPAPPSLSGEWRVTSYAFAGDERLSLSTSSELEAIVGQVIDFAIRPSPFSDGSCAGQTFRELPAGTGKLARYAQAAPRDFQHREMRTALKSCRSSDYNGLPVAVVRELPEIEFSCGGGDAPRIPRVTVLSETHAIGHVTSAYLCLERLPPTEPLPRELSGSWQVTGVALSPRPLSFMNKLGEKTQEGPGEAAADPVSWRGQTLSFGSQRDLGARLCPELRAVRRTSHEGALLSLAASYDEPKQEVAKAALAACGLAAPEDPAKLARRYDEVSLSCGPHRQPAFIRWVSLVDRRRLIAATERAFLCLERK